MAAVFYMGAFAVFGLFAIIADAIHNMFIW